MRNQRNMYECFFPSDLKEHPLNRQSGLKVSLEDFSKITHLRLNHATSSVFLESILEKGILPNALSKNKIEDNLSTDSECVYLSATYDSYYPKRAVKKYGGEGIVITVEVEIELLEADLHAFSSNDLMSGENLSDQMLFNSLTTMFGACKYNGIILPSNIVSVNLMSGEEVLI